MPHEFSIPTNAEKVSTGPDWLHEVKYDGYRMMVIRERDKVRMISTGGYDWAPRFPLIVEAARKLRQSHFIIDGEAVVLGPDGISDFAKLQSTTNRRSSMPSTCSPATARITAGYHSRRAKLTSTDFSRAKSMASS